MARNKFTRIQLRRDSKDNLKRQNPVPRAGEPIVEIDTGLMKIGDGEKEWNDLEYSNSVSRYILDDVMPNTKTIGNINNGIDTINGDITSIKDRIDTNDGDITSIKDHIDTNDTDITLIKERIDTNDSDITLIKDRIDNQISSIDERIESIVENVGSNADTIDTIAKILSSEGYSDINIDDVKFDGSSTTKVIEVNNSTESTVNVTWNIDGDAKSVELNGRVVTGKTKSTIKINTSEIGRVECKLVAKGAIGSVTKISHIYILNDIYYGVSDIPSPYDENFIKEHLQSSKVSTFYHDKWTTYTVPTITADVGKYIFIAIPEQLIENNVYFNINGFDDTWERYQDPISVTNASGKQMDYILFKSGQSGLGSTTITMKNK